MVSPEQQLKFQIKSQLHFAGIPEGKPMDDLVDEIYDSIFDDRNLASLRYVLAEISEISEISERKDE